MDINKNIGDTLNLRIKFVKADGTEAVGIVPDATPNWSDNNPAVDTLSESVDGLTANGPVIGAGTDAIKVDFLVAGKPYSATVNVNASAVAPAFDHVEIVEV